MTLEEILEKTKSNLIISDAFTKADQVLNHMDYQNIACSVSGFGGRLNIKTYEGVMHASVGDYIIKGVQGEFYPCKPEIFEQTYEEVIERREE